MTMSEYENLKMNELCDKLQENEKKQDAIYQTYRRAAEFDEDMRELKKDEKFIRFYMQSKAGM